jgi:hypothetical protein
MRGYKDFNFPAFDYAAEKMRETGALVFSPADRDREEFKAGAEKSNTGDEAEMAGRLNMTALELRRNCFRADMAWICDYADAVALLPGWEQSKGAVAEKALADALGLTVIVLGSEYVR